MGQNSSAKAQEVFLQLQQQLTSGVWKSGDRLPTEKELCAAYSTSRSTVRNALSRLIGLGLVVSHQGKGSFVAESAQKENPLFAPDQADWLSIFEFRRAVEGECAALAAIRTNAAQLEEMEQCVLSMETDSSEEETAQQDLTFHRLLVQATGNPVFMQIFDVMSPLYTRMFQENVALLGNRGVDFHRRILAEIRARDMEAARQCMLDHLDDTMRALSRKRT